jgi:hypothetical protein
VNPDPRFWRLKFKNITAKKIIFSDLILPPYRTSKLQEKPSALKREHAALQQMKFINFFSIFVGHFCPLGSGSGNPIESGSNPDQQHCLKL